MKKKDRTYFLVQDLIIINEAVVPLHPVVPNPYTLLESIPAYTSWFTTPDLKDAFFCILLEKQSQSLFAFEWTTPGNLWTANLDCPHPGV